jgi:hypothetical protein
MSHHLTLLTAGKLALLGLFSATAAAAQTAPALSSVPPSSPPAWTVAAGYESFWLRDVASSRPAVDGSPITWEGAGPAVSVFYERGSPGRLHHFEGSFVSSGGFSLASPVRTTPAPSDDRATRAGGRYEYRRYPFHDLGRRASTSDSASKPTASTWPSNATSRRTSRCTPASPTWEAPASWPPGSVAGAHWICRWPGPTGVSIGRASSRHQAAAETRIDQWGGGWQTHLHVRAGVRVASRAAVLLSYLTSGEGRYASHETYTFGRSRFALGVTYER